MEELARASLALHDRLIEVEGSISYEPAVGSRVSVDPVIQAAGVDEETQDLLDSALDEVLEALYAGGEGPEAASRVPAWAYEGLVSATMP